MGGAERALVEVLNRIDYQRYDVTLFLLYRVGVFLDRVPKEVHFKQESFGRFFPGYIGRLSIRLGWRNLLLRRCAKRVFANERYDTIISFMESGPAKFHSYIIGSGTRNISWVHCDMYNNHYSTLFFRFFRQERRFYDSVDDVVFVSNDSKMQFEKLFRLDKGRVIHNIVDQKAICRLAAEPLEELQRRTFTFVNVGSLKHIKRQDRIIEVAALLKARGYDADFWILGEGILEKELKAYASSLDVADRVHFLGFKSNPYPYIAAADAFLLTSDSEGFSLVVAEAMCLGKAVISTSTVGPKEILDNGRYGILTGFYSQEISDAAASLMKDSTLLALYQRLALERAGAFFNVDNVIAQINEVISN